MQQGVVNPALMKPALVLARFELSWRALRSIQAAARYCSMLQAAWATATAAAAAAGGGYMPVVGCGFYVSTLCRVVLRTREVEGGGLSGLYSWL